jgi:uncharacterized membrane protein
MLKASLYNKMISIYTKQMIRSGILRIMLQSRTFNFFIDGWLFFSNLLLYFKQSFFVNVLVHYPHQNIL